MKPINMDMNFSDLYSAYTLLDFKESLQIWLESAHNRGFIENKKRHKQKNRQLSEKYIQTKLLQDVGVKQSDFKKAWELHHKLSLLAFESIYKIFLINYPNTSPIMKLGIDVEVLARLFRLAIKFGHLVKNEKKEYVKQTQSPPKNCRKINLGDPFSSNHKLSQWSCTWESSERRAKKIVEDLQSNGKKALFLGDGDFTSIALASCSDFIIDVVEYDKRIVRRIIDISKKENLKINVHHHNLCEGLPNNLRNNFDLFCTDPIYTLAGIKIFLKAGCEALKKESGTRGYISLSHHMFGNMSIKVQQYLNKMGFLIDTILPNFNKYPTSKNIPEIKASLQMFDDLDIEDDFLNTYAPFVYTSFYSLIFVNQKLKTPRTTCSNEHDYVFQGQ